MSTFGNRDLCLSAAPSLRQWTTPARETVAASCNPRSDRQLLRTGQAMKLPARRGFAEIRCVSGRLWITQFDDSRDLILRPEQSVRVDLRRKVVLQGLTDCAFSIS